MNEKPIIQIGNHKFPRVMNHPHDPGTGICRLCNYVGHHSTKCPLRPQYKFSLYKHYSKSRSMKFVPVGKKSSIYIGEVENVGQ